MSEYIKMVRDLAKDPKAIIASMTETRVNILHAMLGINDELLELAAALKEKDHENLLEELGDCLFYTEMLGQELGVTLEDIRYELTNFTIAKAESFDTIYSMANEAVTFAKRIGIYCKEYDKADLKGFYVRTQMLLKEIATLFDEELQAAFAEKFRDVEISFEIRRATPLQLIREANMQKLLKGNTARYKSGTYSDEQANARADKTTE